MRVVRNWTANERSKKKKKYWLSHYRVRIYESWPPKLIEIYIYINLFTSGSSISNIISWTSETCVRYTEWYRLMLFRGDRWNRRIIICIQSGVRQVVSACEYHRVRTRKKVSWHFIHSDRLLRVPLARFSTPQRVLEAGTRDTERRKERKKFVRQKIMRASAEKKRERQTKS